MKKQMKLIVGATSILTLGMVGQAMAFHDGGVAKCESCHTMHNSLNGVQMNANLGSMLLQGSDQSSVCLNCHGKGSTLSGYHVKTQGVTTAGTPMQRTPGGDFSWLQIDCDPANVNRAAARGHNIISVDNSMGVDPQKATAPGGSYPGTALHCSSCHDPHGQTRVASDGTQSKPTLGQTSLPIAGSGSYGAPIPAGEALGTYRILGGAGYTAKSSGVAGFANPAPAAAAPSSYNVATAGGARVAYGSGMSEWCANCHGAFHAAGETSGSFSAHPAGNDYDLGAIALNYNAYVKTGDLTGTTPSIINNLVPVELGKGNDAAGRVDMLAFVTTAANASSTDNVMCLSCHRAHASGFESMLRWNQGNTLLTDGAGAYSVQPGHGSATVTEAAYQGLPSTTFAAEQRSLCNKCHVKD